MQLRRVHLDRLAYIVFFAVILLAPLFLDEFALNRVGRYLVLGMLGAAISLSWGYAGILNLGQGLFFGLGAYALGMSLKLSSPVSLQQGSPTPVPDFMLWNAEPGAPVTLWAINKVSFLWIPFQWQWVGLVLGIVLPVTVAVGLGTLLFAKRVTGPYVSIILLALVLLVRLLVVEWQPLTNGYNGLTELGTFHIGAWAFDAYDGKTYYLIAIALIVSLTGTKVLLETRAGLVLQAMRDDPVRARYLGYNVPVFMAFFFSVSAAIAGVAGMLYVIACEFASPTFMDLSFSISMVMWAAVGGRRSVLGACIGAILVNLIATTASETDALLEGWKAVLGIIFLLTVLFLPRGMAGLIGDLADGLIAQLTRVLGPQARDLRTREVRR